LNYYGLGYSSLLPSYVFAASLKDTRSCIFEAIILNIPSSLLIDSNIGYYGIFYGLASNDEGFAGIFMMSKLFMKIYLKSSYDKLDALLRNAETKGRKKEMSKISRRFIKKRIRKRRR